MADRIKGITVEIGGDTTGLSKALSGVNKEISTTQKQLRDVERLLKLDPGNVTLLEQKQRLLADSVEQTKQKLDSLKSAEKQVQQQFAEGKISQAQYDALQREIVETEADLKKAEKAAKDFGSVVGQEMQAAGNKIGEVGDKISKVGDKISGAGQKLMPVTTAIAGLGTASVVSASNFESSMAKLQTIADSSKLSTDKMKAQILEVSNQYGISAADIAEAAYSAISAGQDTEDAVGFVADAMQLAKAGFTDSATAIDTLTTIINAYGDASGSAASISDKLITAQNLGKTTVAELGSSMGKAIPTAAMYGVTLDNLASSYVTTTKNGISTAESTTYINSMLNELGKSGSTVSDLLKQKTGKSFKDLMTDGMSLSDVLAIVQQAADDSGKSMADMFSSQEAAKAAATITQHADDFTEAMNAMVDSSGKAEEAFKTIDETTATSAEKLKTSAQNLMITFGEMLIPVVEDIIGYVQQFVDWLGTLDESQRQTIIQVLAVVAALGPALVIFGKIISVGGSIVSGIGRIITAGGALMGFITSTAVPGITGALSGLFAFLAANPVVLIIAGITAAVVTLVVLITTKGEEIKALLASFNEWLQGVFATDWTEIFGPILGGVLNGFFALVKGIWDGVYQILGGVIDFIQGIFTGNWEQAWNGVQQIVSGVWDNITLLIRGACDLIESILSGLDSWLQGVFKTDWTEIFGPGLGDIINAFMKNVENTWNAIKRIFGGVIDFIKGVFTGNWEQAWQGVVDIFGGLFDSLVNMVKAPLNGIIGLLNGAVSAINSLIGGLNSISFTMPKWLGGGHFGLSIPYIPNIPYLAKGGILSQGSAIVGEAGPELLTMMGNRAMVQPLTNNTTNRTDLGGVNITVYGAPGQDVRALADIIMDEMQNATERKAAVFGA